MLSGIYVIGTASENNMRRSCKVCDYAFGLLGSPTYGELLFSSLSCGQHQLFENNAPCHDTSYNANANKQAESTAREELKNCNGAPPAAEVGLELNAEDVLELFEEEVLEAVPFENEVNAELVIVVCGEDVVVDKVEEGVESTTRVEADEVVADVVDAVTVLPDTVIAEVDDVWVELELLVELEELSEPPVRWKGYDS